MRRHLYPNVLFLFLFFLFPASLFARTGNEIISTANIYLNHSWTCNKWNAREVNRDTIPENNDNNYPFFPKGAAIGGRDEQGKPILEDDGVYTGESYAWGLRDKTGDFDSKLSSTDPKFLAGSAEGDGTHPDKYAGIDCAGFVENCMGFPMVNPPDDKNRWRWHPGCNHLINYFTDGISWDDLKKGDVLITPWHIMIFLSWANTEKTKVNVIESIGGTTRKVVKNTYTKANLISDGYNPRRFPVPYLKKVVIKQGDKILYNGEWVKEGTGRKLEVGKIKGAKPGKITFELEFNIPMAVKLSGKMIDDIKVTFGREPPYNQYEIKPVNDPANGWYEGWKRLAYPDNRWIYKKWKGTFTLKDENFENYEGIYHLSVYAKNLTHDELDAEPSTIAKRTNAGGWTDYTAGKDIKHKFRIGPVVRVIQPKQNDIVTGVFNAKVRLHPWDYPVFKVELFCCNKKIRETIGFWTPLHPAEIEYYLNSAPAYNGIHHLWAKAYGTKENVWVSDTKAYDTKENVWVSDTVDYDIENEHPGNDHPDEGNFNVTYGEPEYIEPSLFPGWSKVGVYMRGFAGDAIKMMREMKVPVYFVNPTFDPEEVAESTKVLFIPTGGLYGMEGSEETRHLFEEYVRDYGGTVICLTQQHGDEFSALPVPEGETLSGYGWSEDMSCHYKAVGMTNYHQILASQENTEVNANVDGYFYDWPEDAKVLLSRTKNAMPALLMYPYGDGWVILSSLYSDWGYGHSGASQSELDIIRDMVSWAVKPVDSLPEYRDGDTISLRVKVKSEKSNTKEADVVKLKVYGPNRNLTSTLNFELGTPLQPGDSTTVTYTGTATTPYGIWWIKYTLLDSVGNVIQEEVDTQRFVVSNPPQLYVPSDLSFSVQSDAEYYFAGDSGLFTIRVWNRGNTDRKTRCKLWFPSHFGGSGGNPRYEYDTLLFVPAQGEAAFIYELDIIFTSDRCWANFFDEDGKYLGSASRAFYVVAPQVDISVSTSAPIYKRGDEVKILANYQNLVPARYNFDRIFSVIDPYNNVIFADTSNIYISGDGVLSDSALFYLPQNAPIGIYRTIVECLRNRRLIGISESDFKVITAPHLVIIPTLPETFTIGSNATSVDIKNTGGTTSMGDILSLSVFDPDNQEIWDYKNVIDSLYSGIDTVINIDIPFSEIKFGGYLFMYEIASSTESIKVGREEVLNCNALSRFYKDGDEYFLSVQNTGKFVEDKIGWTVDIPDFGWQNSGIISLNPGEDVKIPLNIEIPDTTTSGYHDVNTKLQLANSISKRFNIYVPPSHLEMALMDKEGEIKDSLRVKVKNTGGVSTNFKTIYYLADKKWNSLEVDTIENSVNRGDSVCFFVKIPDGLPTGYYYLWIDLYDLGTDEYAYLMETVKILGLEANLSVQTDKEIYLSTEDITGIADIENQKSKIDSANLHLKIIAPIILNTHKWGTKEDWDSGIRENAYAEEGELKLAPHYLFTKEIREEPHNYFWPTDIAVDDEGYIYVANWWPFEIEKFDSNGNFVKKWGSYGSGEGEFIFEQGIAIDNDGNIYVADGDNNRIQKFDNEGNFIMKWGKYGTGNGEFHEPIDIAIDKYGYVYIADTRNARIQKFDGNGNFICKWGEPGIGDGQFDFPQGIAVDKYGYVYVADYGNNRIQKFDADGNFIKKWGKYGTGDGEFIGPRSVALDPNGEFVYVADLWNHRIQVFDTSGVFITKWGCIGPNAIAVDKNGLIYISEGLERLQVFRPAGYSPIGTWRGVFSPEKKVNFSRIDWAGIEPEGTNIKFRTRTAMEEDKLQYAQWSPYYEASGEIVLSPPGRWIEVEATLETSDSTITPRLDWAQVEWGGGKVLWEKDTTVSVDSASSLEVSADAGKLDTTGKFYLKGELTTKTGQKFGEDRYPFYVFDGDFAIIMNKDKDVYRAGDTVRITGEVRNLSDTDAEGLVLSIMKDSVEIYTEDFDLAGLDTHPFTLNIEGDKTFSLKGEVIQSDAVLAEADEVVNVSLPVIEPHFYVLDTIVGSEPFSGFLDIYNPGLLPAYLNIELGNDTFTDTVEVGQRLAVAGDYRIKSDTTITAVISRDWNETLSVDMKFGEALDIALFPDAVYPEGVVDIPYKIFSLGELTPSEVRYKFLLSDSSGGEIVDSGVVYQPEKPGAKFEGMWGSYGTGNGQFNSPIGIAVDKNGYVYVADLGNNRIQKFDVEGNFIKKWGSNGTGDGEFNAPIGIAIDKYGYVYVTDAGNNRVQKFDADGNFIKKWGSYGTENGEFGYPAGIAVDEWNVYVADFGNSRVQVFDKDGNFVKEWSVSSPAGIDVKGEYVYVTEYYSGLVKVFDKDGNLIREWGEDGEFSYPEDITVDDYGFVYVSDTGNHRVQVFTPDGKFLYKFGSNGTSPGEFQWVGATAFFKDMIYAVDYGNNRIQRFSITGTGGDLVYNLTKGKYKIQGIIENRDGFVRYDSTETSFRVAPFNVVKIDTIIVQADTSDTAGRFPVDVVLWNAGANEFVGKLKVQNMGLNDNNTSFEGEKDIEIPVNERITLRFNPSADVPEGAYKAKAVVELGGAPIEEDSVNFTLKPKYILTSIPDGMSFTAGYSGKMPVKVKNKGTAYGFCNLSVSVGDLIDDKHLMFISPAEEKEDTFGFTLAPDLQDKNYYGVAKTEDDEKDFTIHIAGYKIDVSAELDKDAYYEGDTAVFTIDVNNLNAHTFYPYAVVRFNEYDKSEAFVLGGYLNGVDIDRSPGDIILSDSSGVYVSPAYPVDAGSLSVSIDADVPSVAGMKFEGRYSEDGIIWGGWYEIPQGVRIPVDKGYIQYRITMETQDINQPVVVHRIQVGKWIADTQEDFSYSRKKLIFRVPVHHTGAKLFYGIYAETGRALYLNSMYVRERTGIFDLFTDKDVYDAGDSVNVKVVSRDKGMLHWDVWGQMYPKPAGSLYVSLPETTFSFVTSSDAASGGYYIHYIFTPDSGDVIENWYAFDIIGYSLRVLECRLDSNRYTTGDTIQALYKVEANRAFDALIKGWVKDKDWNYYESFTGVVPLDEGLNTFYIRGDMASEVAGPGALIYGFYKPVAGLEDGILLASGAEGFDIFIPDTIPPEILSLYADPEIFNPLIGEHTEIYYTVSEPISLIQFEISDTLGNPVREIEVSNGEPTGSVIWDGQDRAGEVVEPGIYKITALAVDTAGNVSLPLWTFVRVITDTTPPITEINIGEPKYQPDSQLTYITSQTPITLTSTDDISGVDTIYYSIDDGGWIVYNGEWKIPAEGLHIVKYYAVDKAGNREGIKSIELRVDNTTPISDMYVSEPEYESLYITSNTNVTIGAYDPISEGVASGVHFVKWEIGSEKYEVKDSIATFNVTGEDGTYFIHYYSIDNLGNAEVVKEDSLILDNTAPLTLLNIDMPVYQGKYTYITSSSPFILNASDNLSGVQGTRFKVQGSDWEEVEDSIATFNVTGGDGEYTIQYYSIDNVGNTEDVKDTIVYLDNTPPTTSIEIGNPKYSENPTYITSSTPISLTATDGTGSGVSKIEYKLGTGDWIDYNTPFSIPDEGMHTITYRSTDNLGNIETEKSYDVAVDNTPPISDFIVNNPKFIDANGNVYITSSTELEVTALDPVVNGVASGVAKTEYRINNGDWITYTGAFTITGEDGDYKIDYRSVDNVTNLETYKTFNIKLDNTPPITSIDIGNPKFEDGGKIFITSTSPITLTAYDPVVNGVASGMEKIEYRINNGNWIVYDSSFNITGIDGDYTIDYRGIDNLGNTEIYQSIVITLDNTPPTTTYTIGDPKYSENPTYITSQTPITLNVTDGDGSGVKISEYRIDGESWVSYTGTVTFNLSAYGEGLHTIYYRSVDNVGNQEAEKSVEVAVDDTHPLSSLAIGNPKYIYGSGDSVIITSQTPETLSAYDPIINGVASGVQCVRFKVQGSDWEEVNDSIAVFNITGADGEYTIRYYSIDNLGNTEPENTKEVILDNTPPMVEIWSPPDSTMVNQLLIVQGKVSDIHISHWYLEYGEGDNPANWTPLSEGETDTTGIIGNWDTGSLSDGVYTLRLRAEDVVGNKAEDRHTILVGEPEFLFEITGLKKPEGVAIEVGTEKWEVGSGDIYVADRNNKRIAVFDNFGTFLWDIPDLHHPDDVWVDGGIYTTLWWSHTHPTLLEYNETGDSLLLSVDGLNHPKGVQVWNDNIYTADRDNNRLVILDTLGNIIFTIDSIQHPEGIAVDDSGYIYTCENGDMTDTLTRILKFDGDGNLVGSFGSYGSDIGEFIKPSDVEVDKRYRIYVADRNNDRIQCFDRFGNSLLAFGTIGHNPGEFNKPEGIAVNSGDGDVVKRIYVADRNNDRVCVFGINFPTLIAMMKSGSFAGDVPLEIEEAVPWPNPTSNISHIRVRISRDAHLRIRIYTLGGSLVWEDEKEGFSGINEFEWGLVNKIGEPVMNGVYGYAIEAESGNEKVKAYGKIAVIK